MLTGGKERRWHRSSIENRLFFAGDAPMPYRTVRSLLLFLFAVSPWLGGAASQGFTPAEDVLFEHRPDRQDWRLLHDTSLFGKLSNIKSEQDDGLFIEIPGERKKTEIGIGSKVPRVWLDDFGPDARVTLTFELDPQRSDRFSLHLTQSFGEWALSQYGMVFYWQPADDGNGSVYGWYETPGPKNKPPVDHPQGSSERHAPTRVSVTISPGQVSVGVDDLPPLQGPWSLARPHTGFFVYAFTRTGSDGTPSRLGLKRITLSHEPDGTAEPPPPADAMFPATDLLAADALQKWKVIEEGSKDLGRFAQLAVGSMRVDVPAKNGWGRVGFTSTVPLADVDVLVDKAPYLVELALDPDNTSGLYFILGTEGIGLADDNVRRTRYDARFSVIRLSDDDHYTLQVRHGYYENWVRPLPPDWDGRLQIWIAWNSLSVRVPGGPGIRGDMPRSPSQKGKPLYATLLAAPARSGQPSRFDLNVLTIRQPPGAEVDMQTRYRLIPADRFDADAYLQFLRHRARQALGEFLDRPGPGEAR